MGCFLIFLTPSMPVPVIIEKKQAPSIRLDNKFVNICSIKEYSTETPQTYE